MESRADRYAGAGVFLAVFGLYLLTLAPTVTFWDSGELVLGAVALGIPHPPAYPAFCVLGNAFYYLPFGSAAYRLNLFSALFGALSAYLIFRLVFEVAGSGPARTPVSASAALAFAFAGPYWANAVAAEVYTLNTVLLTALAYALYRHDAEGREAWLHTFSFVLGLALATHQSAVFLLPAVALYYVLAAGPLKRPSRPFVSAFFLLFGYSVMLYLPVRAAAGPLINIGDPQLLYGFKWVVKYSEHASTLGYVPRKAAALAGGVKVLVAALAACAAAVYLFRKKPYALFLLFASASYIAGITLLTSGYTESLRFGLQKKFYMPALLFALPLAAYAVNRLAGRLADASGTGRAAVALAAWALLAVPAAELYHGYHRYDNSRNFFAFDFASNTLKSVRQDGVVLAWGDNGIFPVWYMQGHERYRDDVLFIHTELLTHYWYTAGVTKEVLARFGFALKPPPDLGDTGLNVRMIRDALEDAVPLYLDYSAAGKLGADLRTLKPQGLVHLVGRWRMEPLERIWDRYVLRGAYDGTTSKAFAAEGILSIYGYECGIWAQKAYAEGRSQEAFRAYELMKKLGAGDRYLDAWAEKLRGG